MSRVGFAVVLFAVALGLWLGPRPYQESQVVAQQQAQQKKKLPPLTIDTESPLMLEESKKKSTDADVSPSVAENTACYVCHANYSDEPLVQWHGDGGVGCIDCHGKSYEHRNDENNTTPPDIMFPLAEIDESCEDCHDTHDVLAADVVVRLKERVPRLRDGERVVCTQCHGQHRLGHRTVVWDRTTRKLLTGSDESPRKEARPNLTSLKKLVGTWVQAAPDGSPSDKVISTYRVTAAGSAVVEVLFPGGEHEMVTVYHQDGDDLLLTHYCAAGNQPRMKCVAGDDPHVLAFEFIDATNMQSLDDHHMHAGTIRIMGPDRIQAEWQALKDGKAVGSVRFDLLRKK